MSDEDERHSSSNLSSHNEVDNRRLGEIKSELQRLQRQKKRYDAEKLTEEADFLRGEIDNLRNAINDVNKQINVQIRSRNTLRYEMGTLRSQAGLRYTNLATALKDKRRYENELKKPDKPEEYRQLARDNINSIDKALPTLREEDNFKTRIKTTEIAQKEASDRRQKLEDSLNKNLRKQNEIKESLDETAEILPQIEATIVSLRNERDRLMSVAQTSTTGSKKQRRRLSAAQRTTTDAQAAALTPVRQLATLEADTLEIEQRQHEEQLEKVRRLIKYFREQMAEHDLSMGDTPCSTPSTELISPLYNPLTPHEEQTILSSYMDERDHTLNDGHSLSKMTTTTHNEQPAAIAMKLPRNFAPLDLNATTSNQIIHSPYFDRAGTEYKKELSSDIVDKYGGMGHAKKAKQFQRQLSTTTGKKPKKNKKGFGMKHSSHMIALYDDVRALSGSSDTLPSMPMYEYELPNTIRTLELVQQSLESYLFELSLRRYTLVPSTDDGESAVNDEDDDVRDSAVDTYSETSSLLVEPMAAAKLLPPATPQLSNIPEARSSSSSDDKKTVASSPPSSHHSDSRRTTGPPPSAAYGTLTTVDELPSTSLLLPLSIQIAQIDRQMSDEGYRSVRNEQQQHHHHQQQQAATTISNTNSPLLVRSRSYDCTEKVDKWLSSTTPPSSTAATSIPVADERDDHNEFQATDIDDDGGSEDVNLVEATISVPNH